jgi:hypothetical protein
MWGVAKYLNLSTVLLNGYEREGLWLRHNIKPSIGDRSSAGFSVEIILLLIHQARVIPHLIGGLSDFYSEDKMPAVNTDERPRQFLDDLSHLTGHRVAWYYTLTPGCSAPSS